MDQKKETLRLVQKRKLPAVQRQKKEHFESIKESLK